ncbi:integrase/recombinase XerD [Caballeronia udeis]|uniref:Integrase/recombinase XerD n=1 Tax=Caballeronia udeis TaxID=1232866 RepID=A0ABW8N1G0_9BURK
MNDRALPLISERGAVVGGDVTPAPGSPNRLESPILPPGLTDEAIVGRWLKAKATGRGRLAATTLAQYRIEAERLFWYAHQVDVPISEWTLDEFSEYMEFLQAPEPWAIRRPGVRRGSPEWRPFLGPLSERSAGQTQKIVASLFEWLRDVGYLRANPATGLPTVGRREPEKQARFLSVDDCALLRDAIVSRPDTTREARLLKARDLFLVDLFALTGARTMEAMRGWMRHIRIERLPDALRQAHPEAPEFQWLLRIEHGKGNKARWIPCDEIALSLQAYRIAFGLPPVPAPDETRPLVLSVRRSKWGTWKGIKSRTTIWNVVTGLCGEASEYARQIGQVDDAKRLAHASTHWLRHTYAKGLAQAVSNGLDTRAALENMGHADARTFNQYVDDEPLKRALATSLARRAVL